MVLLILHFILYYIIYILLRTPPKKIFVNLVCFHVITLFIA